MKSNKFYMLIVLLFIGLPGFSQGFDSYLQTIEKNNKQLKAARKLEETRKIQARTGIYPKPFTVNYGYFPDNETVVDRKQTLNATQSFLWPGAYSKMAKLADSREELASLIYQAERINLLSQAQELMIRLIYLNKSQERLGMRLDNAKEQLKGIKQKKELGDGNIMDVNKAEFHMLKIQRKMEQNKSNIRRATKQLNLLNGGVQLDFEADKYPWFPEISLDSIIEQKVESWPALQIANKRHMIAEKNVELEKSLNGPEFNIGYGSETVGNSSFRGILVGASVPLWTNKNKVEAAKAETIYMEEEYQSKQMSMETKTQKLYETCSYLQNSLKDYEEAIKELKGTELLRKSMQLEQISVLDFYREVEYFYDIYDEYLKLERDYYLAQTELYRYKL